MPSKNNLTEIWNIYSDSIIKEGKTVAPSMQGGLKNFGTKPGKGPAGLNSKGSMEIQNKETTDIEQVDGYVAPIDPKTSKKSKDKKNLYSPEKYSSEKFDEKVEKEYKDSININMKSVFDKLFEEVMDGQESEELDALGIDAPEEASGEDDNGDVTVTLDRDMVKQLCDILKAALGEDDAEAEDMEHEDYEEMEEAEDGEAEDEDTHKEAVEMQAAPDGVATLTHPGHNKVGTVKASSGKASGKVKPQHDGGSEMKGGEDLTNPKSKITKGAKTGKAGHDLFA